MIFNELKNKYYYFSHKKCKNNKDNTSKDTLFAKICEKCNSKLNEKEKKELLTKHSNDNNNIKKNLCANCNLNLNNSNSDESTNLIKLSVENIIILNYEKKLILNKLKNFFTSILKNISNKQNVFIGKYFSRWNNSSKLAKYYSNIKNEYENTYASKFEAKIQENNKLIKKLDKEKIEITIKNESLLQSIQVNTLKINTFEDKEKNLNAKLKAITKEKKMVLSDLQKNEANIDNKISNLEKFNKKLESKINKLKEAKQEKNSVLNKYIDEMNNVLDYYEKKNSKKNEFYFKKFKLTCQNFFYIFLMLKIY